MKQPAKISMLKTILMLSTVFLLSAGQILFKLASAEIVISPRGLFSSLLNLKVLLALAVYFTATIFWLILLKGMPLRVAYPFAALAFVIVPTMAHFLLGESLTWNTYVGAAIICLGVLVSVSDRIIL